jgi:uncharacterized protein (TIGR03382 family)
VVLDGEPGDELGFSVAAGPLLLLGMPGVDQVVGLDNYGEQTLLLQGPSDLGHALFWIEDLDDDGIAEAIAVAPGADDTSVDQGVAFVLDGNAVLDAVGSSFPDLDFDGVTSDLDCDDGDPRRSPDEPEICRNDLDDDCDAIVDEQSCLRAGCDATGTTSGLGLSLAGLLLLGLRRRTGRFWPLAFLMGCSNAGEVTLEVEPGPVFGDVPITLTGDGDTLVLYIDGEPVASSQSSPLSWTWDTRTVTDGVHLVRGAGFQGQEEPAEDWQEVTVEQALGDSEPPEVRFSSPQDGGAYPKGSDIFIALQVSDDTCIEDVRVYRYGESTSTHSHQDLLAILPPEGPWELYWEQAAEGSWQLEAHVEDCVGLTDAETITFDVSSTAPVSCTLVEPSADSDVSGTVEIKVAASSDAGIVSVTVTADGVEIGTDASSPWGVTWEAGTTERQVSLAATCSASDGAEAADGFTVNVVESTASDFEATITRPQDGDSVAGSVLIKAAVGGGAGPDRVAFYVGDTLIFEDDVSPWEATWDSTTWPNGDTLIRIIGTESETGLEAADAIDVTVSNGG